MKHPVRRTVALTPKQLVEKLIAEGDFPLEGAPEMNSDGGAGHELGSGSAEDELDDEGGESEETEVEPVGEEEATFVITGPSDQIAAVKRLLAWLGQCCGQGHSGTAEIQVDGDGSGSLSIEGADDVDLSDIQADSSGEPELTVAIGEARKPRDAALEHQLRVARKTLKIASSGERGWIGMTKPEAISLLKKHGYRVKAEDEKD